MTRALTPRGWLLAGLAALIAIAVIAGFWNSLTSWLPWSAESQRDRAVAARDLARSDASARGLEVEGERAQAERVETFHTQELVIRDLTTRADIEARRAPDANDPLTNARAYRLRDHDRRLCDASPGVCRAASPVPAGGGDGDVPAGRAAGEPDTGGP